MFKDDDGPLLSDPRQVLVHVVQRLADRQLQPRVAIELEFNLFKNPLKGNRFATRSPLKVRRAAIYTG